MKTGEATYLRLECSARFMIFPGRIHIQVEVWLQLQTSLIRIFLFLFLDISLKGWKCTNSPMSQIPLRLILFASCTRISIIIINKSRRRSLAPVWRKTKKVHVCAMSGIWKLKIQPAILKPLKHQQLKFRWIELTSSSTITSNAPFFPTSHWLSLRLWSVMSG